MSRTAHNLRRAKLLREKKQGEREFEKKRQRRQAQKDYAKQTGLLQEMRRRRRSKKIEEERSKMTGLRGEYVEEPLPVQILNLRKEYEQAGIRVGPKRKIVPFTSNPELHAKLSADFSDRQQAIDLHLSMAKIPASSGRVRLVKRISKCGSKKRRQFFVSAFLPVLESPESPAFELLRRGTLCVIEAAGAEIAEAGYLKADVDSLTQELASDDPVEAMKKVLLACSQLLVSCLTSVSALALVESARVLQLLQKAHVRTFITPAGEEKELKKLAIWKLSSNCGNEPLELKLGDVHFKQLLPLLAFAKAMDQAVVVQRMAVKTKRSVSEWSCKTFWSNHEI